MIFNGKEIDFPAKIKISFFKLIESLEEQAMDEDDNVARFAKDLLVDVNKFPELRDGFEGEEIPEHLNHIVNRLCRVLFPEALLTNEIKGVAFPYSFDPFYYSTRFKKILEDAGNEFEFRFASVNDDLMYVFAASYILAKHHGLRVPVNSYTTVDILNSKTRIVHTYRMAFNADMIEITPTKSAPPISAEDYKTLLDDFSNIDLWKKMVPPNSFEMRGVGIANFTDVTIDQARTTISRNLLSKSENTFEEIKNSFRNLYRIPDLQVGFIEHIEGQFAHEMKEKFNSILLNSVDKLSCKRDLSDETYDLLLSEIKPLVITDVQAFDKKMQSKVSAVLASQNIGSYILIPLSFDDEILGFIELASPRKLELSGGSLPVLEELVPLFSSSISRFKREYQNQREAIIQQECTTIHPSVKWKFEKEADIFLAERAKGEPAIFNDIVFKDVYPLYGQLDIKGSTNRRNEAIKLDLLKQIEACRSVLTEAILKTGMFLYEALVFRLDDFKAEITQGITSDIEQRILAFISSEINPAFDLLKKEKGSISKLIRKYESILDDNLSTVYEKRREYDSSVNIINQTLAQFLDDKQLEAQKIFPHYYERYKTDGLEYNIYIGQSITNSKTFDHAYLDNLRIWQMLVMCELELAYDQLRKELKTEIEVASLVLVYGNSLSVNFRMDEKRFDVEGAYNARYEIVKKRIDKAHIKNTDERITQPGTISVIYTTEENEKDYLKYIDFLEVKNLIVKNSTEKLELEDLPGISGLKALRVQVNYNKKKGIPMKNLLSKIESN